MRFRCFLQGVAAAPPFLNRSGLYSPQIAANPSISRKELATQIGITADGIKYQLTKLQKKERLQLIGPDKGGTGRLARIDEHASEKTSEGTSEKILATIRQSALQLN